MNRWQLYKALRHHRKLAEKRSFDYERNKAAKWLVGFVVAFIVVYLLMFAILFSLIANDSRQTTALEFIFAVLPFLLFADFDFRFIGQQTPAQIVKPYVLLPIPKHFCIDTFIFNSMFNSGNLIWFVMLVPYCIMSVVFSFGIATTLLLLLFFFLTIVANSQWYLIVRTLINRNMLWWLLPAAVYGLAATPLYIGEHAGIGQMAKQWAALGDAFEHGSIALPFLAVAAMLALLVAINRHLQCKSVYQELSKTKTTKLKTVSRFAFLDRYGRIGQYLKLEIKSILRNKNPRTGFIAATAIVVVFTLLVCYTDIYGDPSMATFWCIYNFVIYGVMLLTKVMGNEGNYIDLLMVHKENILQLLHAKYIFCCAILLLPFLLMLPTVFMGKWPLLMVVSYCLFTAGFQYFLLFQLAVYNKTTTPLNTKFISRRGVENNYWQIAIEMIAFFFPIVSVSVLKMFFSEDAAFITMLVIGLGFIATERLWMANIYRRMMARRYEHLEAFRASR